MTPTLLEPLRQTILSAQFCADPDLRRLAVRRYFVVDSAIAQAPEVLQPLLQDNLFRMLPSDWPLWVESCRPLRPALAA